LSAGKRMLAGSTMYITIAPCNTCADLIRDAGITRIIWPTE
jgi:deoxycytidylate deaminase